MHDESFGFRQRREQLERVRGVRALFRSITLDPAKLSERSREIAFGIETSEVHVLILSALRRRA